MKTSMPDINPYALADLVKLLPGKPGVYYTNMRADMIFRDWSLAKGVAPARSTFVEHARTEILEAERLKIVYRTGKTKTTRFWYNEKAALPIVREKPRPNRNQKKGQSLLVSYTPGADGAPPEIRSLSDDETRQYKVLNEVHAMPGMRRAGEYAKALGLDPGRVLKDLDDLAIAGKVVADDGPTFTTWKPA